MPWGLLIRLGSVLLTAIGMQRMRRAQRPVGPLGTPAQERRAVRRRVQRAREGLSLLTRTVAVAISATFAVISGSAALTLAGPGPHWLAVVFGVVALLALVATLVEALSVRAQVRARRRRSGLDATIRTLDDDPGGAPRSG